MKSGGSESEFSGIREVRERPVKFYHASPAAEIDVLKPRNETIRDPNEGPVVFATPDKAYATAFLFESDDRWTQIGQIDGVHYVLINADRNEFIRQDKGGTLYELPGDSFHSDPTKGHSSEWVSKTEVKPISQENYPSTLDAMINNDVQVYFVDTETFKKFESTHEVEEMKVILNGIKSENKLRNFNVKSFE